MDQSGTGVSQSGREKAGFVTEPDGATLALLCWKFVKHPDRGENTGPAGNFCPFRGSAPSTGLWISIPRRPIEDTQGASGPPVAPLGARNIVMRFELQALPESKAGEADQNEPIYDEQNVRHQGLTLDIAIRFK